MPSVQLQLPCDPPLAEQLATVSTCLHTALALATQMPSEADQVDAPPTMGHGIVYVTVSPARTAMPKLTKWAVSSDASTKPTVDAVWMVCEMAMVLVPATTVSSSVLPPVAE